MNEIPHSHQKQINVRRPPRYISPQVISYSNEEILEQLGPAQTQSKPSNTGLNFGLPDKGMPGSP